MSEPKPMYPVLAKVIERGRLTEEERILTLSDVKWAFRCAMPAIEAFEETL